MYHVHQGCNSVWNGCTRFMRMPLKLIKNHRLLFSCRISSCLKCGCSERHLRLLLSDFPVSFQDVKSISIGAFNSKRAPWNSWLFGCLGTLKDLKVGLENPEAISASKHGENRHNAHNLKSERHCFERSILHTVMFFQGPGQAGDFRCLAGGSFRSMHRPLRYNVPVFLRAWNKVLEDKRFLLYDWTVKADMDTWLLGIFLWAGFRNFQLLRRWIKIAPHSKLFRALDEWHKGDDSSGASRSEDGNGRPANCIT